MENLTEPCYKLTATLPTGTKADRREQKGKKRAKVCHFAPKCALLDRLVWKIHDFDRKINVMNTPPKHKLEAALARLRKLYPLEKIRSFPKYRNITAEKCFKY